MRCGSSASTPRVSRTQSAYSCHEPSYQVTCESPSKARMCVATRSRNQRIVRDDDGSRRTRAALLRAREACRRPGRSSARRAARCRPSGAAWRGAAGSAHPRQVLDPLLLIRAREPEPRDVLPRVDLARAELDRVVAARDLLPDGRVRLQPGPRLVDVRASDGVAEAKDARVGLLLADDQAEQGRLARSVRADHADDPAGGSENARSSKRTRSPYAFATPSASTTVSPRRGPGGMWISTRSSRTSRSSASRRSYAPSRAFDFACRALGLERTHSSSRAERPPPPTPVSPRGEPRLLLLQPGRIVALERNPASTIELQDPARDVVEEVAIA